MSEAYRSVAVDGNVDLGDREIAPRNEILRTEVGSGVHGMAIPGTDDHDEMGVYIEEPDQVLGLAPRPGHWIWRTQPMGARSGPGDVDLTMYSLHKFLRLALAGNPTVLIPLYAQGPAVIACSDLGDELRALTPAIVSTAAASRFLGYLDAQRERMLGRGRQSSVPSRPELVETHGYDTKYASHALRLGRQGVELSTTGQLSLPLPAQDLAQCVAVKRGDVPFETALSWIDEARAELDAVISGGRLALPAEPDLPRLYAWMASAQQRHWAARGLL